MTTLEIIAGATLLLTSILIIIAVMLQSSKGDGLSGAIMGAGAGGGAAKGKDSDAKLANITKILAVIFFIITLAVNIVSLSANKPEDVVDDNTVSASDSVGEDADTDAE